MSKRGDEKRALLIEAAGTVIERIGPRKLTLEDVASEARVSRSTVYYHFDSKGDLIRALIDHLIGHIQQVVVDADDPTAPADERLVRRLAAVAGEVQRLITLYEVSRDIAGELLPMAQGRIDEFGRWQLERTAELIAAGVEEGRFLVDDPMAAARTMDGAFRGMFNPVINDDFSTVVEDSARLLRVLLRGISANPTEVPPC